MTNQHENAQENIREQQENRQRIEDSFMDLLRATYNVQFIDAEPKPKKKRRPRKHSTKHSTTSET